MEEHGIGRPSTYAPTIATITDRGYVERDENKRLAPTAIAFAVNDLLVEHFANIVDKDSLRIWNRSLTISPKEKKSGAR